MATDFLTQVTQASWASPQSGSSTKLGVTVHDVNWSTNKLNPIINPGFAGEFQSDHNRIGSQWVEMGFMSELRGIGSPYVISPADVWDPPPEYALLQAMGMSAFAAEVDGGSGILDDLHLTTDTVHTSGALIPLDILLEVDLYYRGMRNGVGTGVITFEAEAGPPTLVSTFRGEFYQDLTSPTPIIFKYPQTTLPTDWGSITTFRGSQPQTALDETLVFKVIPNDGTYTPVTIANVVLMKSQYDLGNVLAPIKNTGKTYGWDQTLLGKREPAIELMIKVFDPGSSQAEAIVPTTSRFNPEASLERQDLLSIVLTHGSGAGNIIENSYDCYISDVIDYVDDGNGVFVYTLKCQQAIKDPNGSTASQAFKLDWS